MFVLLLLVRIVEPMLGLATLVVGKVLPLCSEDPAEGFDKALSSNNLYLKCTERMNLIIVETIISSS